DGPLDVRVVEGLDGDLDLGGLGGQVDEEALVQDLDDVRARVAEHGRDRGEAAGNVGHLDVEARQAAVADQTAHDHRGEQPRVHVAARQHHPDRPTGEAAAVFEEGGDAGGARALRHDLLDV